MDDLEELKQQIEKLRAHLIRVAEKNQLSDPEVVGASRILDAMLNEYEKLLRKKAGK